MSAAPDPLAERLEPLSAASVLALAAGAVVTALVAIVALASAAAATAEASPLPPPLHRAAVGLPIVAAVYAVGLRVGLRAPAWWFLAGRPDRRLVGWIAIGIALPLAVLAGYLLVLEARVAVPDRPPGSVVALVAGSVASGLLAGVLEELAFRGALLRLLEARWGPRIALAGSAGVFGLLHQGHAADRAELFLVVGAATAAGVLLGVVALRTRSVWNAVAVHAGWNAVFGGSIVTVGPAGAALGEAVVEVQLLGAPGWAVGAHGGPGTAPATAALLLGVAVAVHGLVEPTGSGPPSARRPGVGRG